MKIDYIEIRGLFGDVDYKIVLNDNRLIVVAENGSGKTTIVNIIYYFLSRQWTKLLRYKFSSIKAKINNELIEVKQADLDSPKFTKGLQRQIRTRFPASVQHDIERYLLSEDISAIFRDPSKLDLLSDEMGVPRRYLYEYFEDFAHRRLPLFEETLRNQEEKLTQLIDCQILYLPTYRRIEQELKVIYPGIESELQKYSERKRHTELHPKEVGYIELVEFGMEDVAAKIRRKLRSLQEDLSRKIKNNLAGGFLKDVINNKYRNISYEDMSELDEKSLNSMLDRIDETVLSKFEKSNLISFVRQIDKQTIKKAETKIIAYFISRLLEIYNELKEQEKDIEQFITICNDYSTNKKFIYDNINFRIDIRPLKKAKPVSDEAIELRDLSSGEKQIVSLFSHLFLSQDKDFFIVIDEPELSLSVPWQERFLADVVKSPYCKGLLAVTHSPFIFNNELEPFAHGLNEYFVKSSKK